MCSDEGTGSATQESQGSEGYAPLSIAYLNKAGYEDIIVGDKQGYFAEAGPEVTLHAVTGSDSSRWRLFLRGRLT